MGFFQDLYNEATSADYWNGVANIFKNMGYVYAKTLQSSISVIGAIETLGLTAPIAGVSVASTAQSWYRFFQDPSASELPESDVDKEILNAISLVTSPSSAHTISMILNKSNAIADPTGLSSVPSFFVGNIFNPSNELNRVIKTEAIINGTSGMATPADLLAITDPVHKEMRGFLNANRHGQNVYQTAQASFNLTATRQLQNFNTTPQNTNTEVQNLNTQSLGS